MPRKSTRISKLKEAERQPEENNTTPKQATATRRATISPLRRTQSEALPTASAPDTKDKYCKILSELESESESDLPDASSLLRANKPTAEEEEEEDGISGKRIHGDDTKTNGKGKRKQRRITQLIRSASEMPPPTNGMNGNLSDDNDDDEEEALASLKIPGELVMAYGMRKYYPARIVSRKSANRYRVEFFDGSKSVLSRKRFHTMYENAFYTCPLGGIQLVGDEPAKKNQQLPPLVVNADGSGETESGTNSIEREFEMQMKLCPNLVKKIEDIRPHLDRLHRCSSDNVDEMATNQEDRMGIFFGSDAVAKRKLPSRVSPGFLNRAEFDFLGRLLCRWYSDPPLGTTPSPLSSSTAADTAGVANNDDPASSSDAETNKTEPIDSSGQCTPKIGPVLNDALDKPSDLIQASLAVSFIHEVLLPHAIKRLIIERDDCSLAEAEERMQQGDQEVQWVDQILAIRGDGRDQTK